VVISGYYGFGNAGDEAILASTVASLRSAVSGLGITVISRDPRATSADLDVRAVGRFDLGGVTRALLNSDMLLSGGGSLLQDVTSVRSLVYYLGVMALAKSCGRKVMLFANGFGPVTSRQGKFLCRLVLDRIDVATFRDRNSLQDVRGLGVSRPYAEVTADPVFLLDGMLSPEERARSAEAARTALERSGIPPVGGPLVTVSLRPWKLAPPSFTTVMKTALSRLSAMGARVLLAPLHFDQDVAFCEELAQGTQSPLYVLRERTKPQAVLEIIGLSQAVIGMRLHSLVFAVSKAAPCAAISYDPKVQSFADDAGIPTACDIRGATVETIQAATEDLLNRRAEFSSALAARRNEYVRLARRNVELVKATLMRA
jgi:polysaccharide pyruvyl transferase CsaB